MTIKTPPLALGTANFGLNYGITSGRKVPEDEVSEILNTCREFGVNMIDTAVAYGDCHKILGNVGCSDFHIVTKVPKIPTETKNVRDWLYRTIDNALIDLNRSDLDGLLFHHPMDLQSPLGSTLAEAAVSIKARFNIQRVGLSLYDPVIKRRSAIEPTIGHMKMDGRLGRNPLKGSLGDALHAVLCGAGHNIRLLLKKLRLLFAQIWQQLVAALFVKTPSLQTA